MTYASVQDVVVAIGRPMSDQDEDDQVTQWLYDVEMLLTAKVGNLSNLDHDVLVYVEREAVARAIRQKDARNSDAPAGEFNPTVAFLGYLSTWWELLKVPNPNGFSALTIRTRQSFMGC